MYPSRFLGADAAGAELIFAGCHTSEASPTSEDKEGGIFRYYGSLTRVSIDQSFSPIIISRITRLSCSGWRRELPEDVPKRTSPIFKANVVKEKRRE